jgi:hypothetical protein
MNLRLTKDHLLQQVQGEPQDDQTLTSPEENVPKKTPTIALPLIQVPLDKCYNEIVKKITLSMKAIKWKEFQMDITEKDLNGVIELFEENLDDWIFKFEKVNEEIMLIRAECTISRERRNYMIMDVKKRLYAQICNLTEKNCPEKKKNL